MRQLHASGHKPGYPRSVGGAEGDRVVRGTTARETRCFWRRASAAPPPRKNERRRPSSKRAPFCGVHGAAYGAGAGDTRAAWQSGRAAPPGHWGGADSSVFCSRRCVQSAPGAAGAAARCVTPAWCRCHSFFWRGPARVALALRVCSTGSSLHAPSLAPRPAFPAPPLIRRCGERAHRPRGVLGGVPRL